MKIEINIDTENAAFEEYGEVRRIIDVAVEKIHSGDKIGSLYDINGNEVGYFKVV